MIWNSLSNYVSGAPWMYWQEGLKGVNAEQFKSRYLDPTGEETYAIKCPHREECVVERCHGLYIRRLYRGTCACCSHRGDVPKTPVILENLEQYSLSFSRFHADICRQLGIKFSGGFFDEVKKFGMIGSARLGAGIELPVYVSYATNARFIEDDVKNLPEMGFSNFALIAVDRDYLSVRTRAELKQRGGYVWGLNEILDLSHDATLVALREIKDLVKTGKAPGPDSVRTTYQCPKGTPWSTISLGVVDNQTISVWLEGSSAINVSYSELGMANGKTKNPNKAFLFLTAMLERASKTIPAPKNICNTDEFKNRIREIKESLKQFFSNVESDPIQYDRHSNSYSLMFNIAKTPVI